MVSVTNIAGQTEALNGVQGFKMVEDTNGKFEIAFTALPIPNNPGYKLIEEEAIIEVDDNEFRVKQLNEVRNRKDVTGISIFYDLKGSRQDTIYGGTKTLDEFVTFSLQGTGWTFISEISESRLIANFGEDNVVKLIETICAAFECEFKILPGKKLLFAKQIGVDSDDPYRYGYNVRAVSKKIDTTKLRTRITGYGLDGLVVTYTSDNHTKFGILVEEPVRSDEFSTAESMTEHLRRTLIDYPEVSFEMDTIELVSKGLGDRVWFIYDPMGIEFQTRVLTKTSGMRNNKTYTKSVVLGNTIPRKLSDILVSQNVQIDQNRKETRSRFTQLNDRFTMEVEEIDKSIASFNIKADSITLDVSNLMGRVAGAEANLTVQAGEISARVKETDFNGNAIVSKINLTAGAASIESGKINLVGFVTISSLNTPGAVTISEGNIVGSSFTVGRGTGNPNLSMYATQGSHRITSADAAGFRIESQANLSLQAGNGLTIYARSKLWAENALQVTGLTQVQELRATGIIHAWGGLQINYQPVATEVWVANMNYLNYSTMTNYIAGLNLTTVAWVNSALATKESQIVAWANGKFALK